MIRLIFYRGNEKVLGELTAKNHWRQQIQIATKMPHYLIHSVDELEKLFCEQLKRLQTDYVDNYLMHMLPDVHIWEKLVRMGILDWIREKKEKGQIRRIGFSYHGNSRNFMALIDAYDWEFCQVQYNYMDIPQSGRCRGCGLCGKERHSSDYYGATAGRQTGERPAEESERFVCGNQTEAQSGGVGTSMALESAGDRSGVIRYEQYGYDPGKYSDCRYSEGRRDDRYR